MTYQEIHNYKDIRQKILLGLDKISEPVRQTLTPKGKNVIYQDDFGNPQVTNDGVTIAKNIELEDPIENVVSTLVKQSALRTNNIAGDGTTTSILLTQEIVKNGFRLIDEGFNAMSLSREIEKNSKLIINEIDKLFYKIKDDKQLEQIALVASNNDKEIAKNISIAVKHAGEDGLIIREVNPDIEDSIVTNEQGFKLEVGFFSPHFINTKNKFEAFHSNAKVLITDKKIFYPEEAIHILTTVADAGFNTLVIIASDFMGQALNVFVKNHIDKKINLLLIKEPTAGEKNFSILEDLSIYLGCPLITEKKGDLTQNLKIEHFGTAKRVLSNPRQTTFLHTKPGMFLNKRIEALKEEKEKVKSPGEKEKLKKRIASMTSGITTISFNAKTDTEAKEKMFRYEDALNATLNSYKTGYVAGGGITLWEAFKNCKDKININLRLLFEKVCQSPLKQIAENCDLHFSTLLSKVSKNIGYNAVTDKYVDLIKAGIIDPTLVVKTAFSSAISAANLILSSDYIITNIKKDDDTKTKQRT